MPSIFLDTSSLIPLIHKEHRDSKKVFRHLENSRMTIDAIVLAEFLVGIPKGERNKIAHDFSSQFHMVQLGNEGAILAADIYSSYLQKNPKLHKDNMEKQFIKTDVLILASVLLSGCDEFLFNDSHFVSLQDCLSELAIDRKLPKFVRIDDLQDELFDNDGGY